MIQQLKLLLIVFASCIVVDSYAQKVVVDGAGRVIIDASAIPNTTMPKARTTDATLYNAGTNTLTNISSELSNEKVFRTFEVSKQYFKNPLNPYILLRVNWLEAIEICYNLSNDGGGWRLPTEREFTLMKILNYKLIEIPGFEKIVVHSAWSATDAVDYSMYQNYAFYLSYDNTIIPSDKAEIRSVRCIRDITP